MCNYTWACKNKITEIEFVYIIVRIIVFCLGGSRFSIFRGAVSADFSACKFTYSFTRGSREWRMMGTDRERKSLCLLFHLSWLHIRERVFCVQPSRIVNVAHVLFFPFFSFCTLLPITMERRENESIVMHDQKDIAVSSRRQFAEKGFSGDSVRRSEDDRPAASRAMTMSKFVKSHRVVWKIELYRVTSTVRRVKS